MYCQIFVGYFLLLFVFYDLYGLECTAQGEPPSGDTDENTFSKFFEAGSEKIKINFGSKGDKKDDCEIAVEEIKSVFLVATDNLMVAFADVNVKDEEAKKIDLLAKFVEKNKDWNTTNLKQSGGDWKTQSVRKNLEKEKEPTVKSSAVVVNDNKIYYFSVNNSQLGVVGPSLADTPKWHITVVVGDFIEKEGQKTITWDSWDSTKIFKKDINLNEKLKPNPGTIPPVVGFGFVVKNKIVFAIQGEGEKENASKNVTAFFEPEETNNLKLLHVEPTENCFFSLFLWEGQIVMIPSVCSNGDKSNQKIKAFDIEKKQFNKNYRSFARLQEFLKNKKNFVTTKIGTTTDVLLFTQQSKNTSNGKYEVYLWVTNGNRTAKVDTIITGNKDNFDLSMLHINNDLFVLYNNYGAAVSSGTNEKSKYNLQRLPDQLNKIKLILEAWKTTDNEIKKLFKKTDTAETPSFTDRLVGFLSGNGEDNQYWKDEYFYENATEINGTKTSEGFKFAGAKAGAKWLVGKLKKEDQPYDFAAFGFTLVATVKIDKDVSEKLNSILGVGLGGTNDKKSIGLWCSKGVWGFGDGKNTKAAKITSETCVQGEKYQVVLSMEGNKISVYIDGKLAKRLPNNPIDVQEEEKDITHFYFGIDDAKQNTKSDIESHVTVTNVLLYNRPFEEKDISNLKECEKTPKVIKNPKEDHGTAAKENEQTSNVPPTLPPSTTGEETAPSPSPTEDGGVGGGVRVFSLLLAVLCVSAPLLHL